MNYDEDPAGLVARAEFPDLSAYARNRLGMARLTRAQVLAMSDDELRKVRLLGKVSIAEIRRKVGSDWRESMSILRSLNLAIRREPQTPEQPIVKQQEVNIVLQEPFPSGESIDRNVTLYLRLHRDGRVGLRVNDWLAELVLTQEQLHQVCAEMTWTVADQQTRLRQERDKLLERVADLDAVIAGLAGETDRSH